MSGIITIYHGSIGEIRILCVEDGTTVLNELVAAYKTHTPLVVATNEGNTVVPYNVLINSVQEVEE
jgi:hypothetical protein